MTTHSEHLQRSRVTYKYADRKKILLRRHETNNRGVANWSLESFSLQMLAAVGNRQCRRRLGVSLSKVRDKISAFKDSKIPFMFSAHVLKTRAVPVGRYGTKYNTVQYGDICRKKYVGYFASVLHLIILLCI